ncbi:MAG: glycosyltransferase family 4 protein [Gemmatimonadales bacterium]|nr:glycosyltransferase family 4 protein [Gemmatimonadales bacterium]
MKTVLVFFDKISDDSNQGFGFLNQRLAASLHKAGVLEKMVCLQRGPEVDIPPERTIALFDAPHYRFAFQALGKLTSIFPRFDSRRWKEILFDLFMCRRLKMRKGDLLFCTRPLFLKTVQIAKSRRMKVWIMSSVPHPLLNFALVRNEELRLSLDSRGAYTDIRRVNRLNLVTNMADKVLTLAPEIGKFTHGSYLQFLGPDRILPQRKYFNLDPANYESLAECRKDPGGEGITFLHVSFMNLIKGIPYLLDAWSNFQSLGIPGCRLVLVGKIDPNVRFLLETKYSNIHGVEIKGFVKDLPGEFAAAHVFISPSISDAGPATIIEAMASGLPVISSRNCGFASLINERENGFTYAYNDVKRLTEIMAWFAQNPQEIPLLGQNARSGVANRSIDDCAKEVLELIHCAGD